jgi:regulatory protein
MLVVVEVDGARFVEVPRDEARKLGVAGGVELSDALVADLRAAGEAEAAYQVALRMLAHRPHAVAEVVRKLRQKGHGKYAVAKAVGRLESSGVLDDAEFARHFVQVRAPKGFGPPRLLRDLLGRGIERRAAERAIAEVVESDEVDLSRQRAALAEKRARQLHGLPERVVKRRVAGYLRRRGL